MSRLATTSVAALVAALCVAPTALAGPGLSASERGLLRQVNTVRAQHGLARLAPSRALSRAAEHHSRDMLRRDFFSHSSSDGTPFQQRVRRYADAAYVGETLAAIRSRRGGAQAVVRMWMNSPAHRAIVLDPGFERIGLGRRWGRLGAAPNAVVTADFAS